MHQTRFFVIALISFFAVIAGAMLQKAITIFLCSILSFNSNFCYWLDNSRANAAIPPVTADSTSIIAQDIDIFSPDGSSSPPPQTDIFAPPNPQNQPQPQPGIDIFAPSNPSQPNQPQSIPQVNRSDANYSNQPSFLTVERGRRYQLKGAASNGSKRYTAELIVADDQTFLSSIVLAARTASSSQELIYNVQFERTGFGFTMTTNSGQAWTLRKIGSDRWMSQFTNADGTSKNWEFPALRSSYTLPNRVVFLTNNFHNQKSNSTRKYIIANNPCSPTDAIINDIVDGLDQVIEEIVGWFIAFLK